MSLTNEIDELVRLTLTAAAVAYARAAGADQYEQATEWADEAMASGASWAEICTRLDAKGPSRRIHTEYRAPVWKRDGY